MLKNTAGQKWTVFAFDSTTNLPVMGDASNITADLRLDGGAANPVNDTNPTELEHGYYCFDISQAESNADMILISPVSSTTNVIVIGVPGSVWTTVPTAVEVAAIIAGLTVSPSGSPIIPPVNATGGFTTTVTDVIKDAMGIIGAIAMDEAPSASEMQICLRALNVMLDHWSAHKLMIRASVMENFPITQSVAAYTIGSGGTFNTSKPYDILYGFTRDQNKNDRNLEVITKQQYDSYEDKTISSSCPDYLAYDPGVTQQSSQLGTIYLYPFPDRSVYTLYIASHKMLTDFTGITDTVTFEPVYSEALSYNLAVRIWRRFRPINQDIPLDIIHFAEDSLRTIQRLNSTIPRASMDLPGQKSGTGYNILSDTEQ